MQDKLSKIVVDSLLVLLFLGLLILPVTSMGFVRMRETGDVLSAEDVVTPEVISEATESTSSPSRRF